MKRSLHARSSFSPTPAPLGGGTVCHSLLRLLSNEAWYRDSLDMDQMVAFERLDAIATGRSVVRATNSGVSCVLDPSGALLGRIEDAEGRRKMVAGHLAVQVPVPVRRTWTPWARTYRWQPWLWAALCLAILASARVTAAGAAGSGCRRRLRGGCCDNHCGGCSG